MRGSSQGLGEAGCAGWGHRSAVDDPLSPPAVPLALRATPSSRVGSADLPVSIVATTPGTFLGCPPGPKPHEPWGAALLRPCLFRLCLAHSQHHFVPPDQEIVRCDERGSTGSPGEVCHCKVCTPSLPNLGHLGPWHTAVGGRKEVPFSPWLLGWWVGA